MKKYLIFDLDGTLTDPGVGITTCVQYALESFGIEEKDTKKLEAFIGPPLKESFMDFYDFDEEQADAAVAKYRERFQDKGIYENKVYQGIPEMLGTLQSKGFYLAVASSKPQVFVERILVHFNLRKYFSVVVGSDAVAKREKKEEVLQEALRALFAYQTVQETQVYMIGDRSYDIKAAKFMGVESVGVTYGYGSMAELKTARADYIVQSVEELEKFLLRETEEKKETSEPKGLNMHRIWVMLYSFLIFMVMRSIIVQALDLLCVKLWDMAVSPELDSLLFVRDPEIIGEEGFAFTGAQIVLKQMLGFIGGALVIWKNAKLMIQETKEDTKLSHLRRKGKIAYLLTLGAVIGSVIGLNLMMELTGIVDNSAAYQRVVADAYSAPFLLGLLHFGLITPIAEELLFRGIIHNYLRRFVGAKMALLVSSALFGVYHMNYVQGIYAFLMGCLIAFVYEYFGEFDKAVAVHVMANVMVYCLSYTPIVNTAFVSWPVCIGCGGAAVLCLWLMSYRKNVF